VPLNITTASGNGHILGMRWRPATLRPDVTQPPLPPGSAVVNDWFWGGQAPDATVIPWTWLGAPLELRADQPINQATVTRDGDFQKVVNAAASQATYGVFAVSATMATLSVDDALNLATFLTTYYANPLMRCPTVSISLVHRNDEERWRVLGREIGDRFTLGPGTVQDAPGHTTVLPVPAGLPIGAQSLVIEGIQTASSVTDRVVEWTTAPLLGASPGVEGPWFRIDQSSFGSSDAIPF